MNEQTTTFVAVTIRSLYAFPTGMDGRTNDEIIDEWFRKYPINSHHASREYAKVCDTVIEVQKVAGEELRAMFPHVFSEQKI